MRQQNLKQKSFENIRIWSHWLKIMKCPNLGGSADLSQYRSKSLQAQWPDTWQSAIHYQSELFLLSGFWFEQSVHGMVLGAPLKIYVHSIIVPRYVRFIIQRCNWLQLMCCYYNYRYIESTISWQSCGI